MIMSNLSSFWTCLPSIVYWHMFEIQDIELVWIYLCCKHSWRYTPFLWCRRFYDTAVFILSVPMHCSATRGFFYLYIHKHNSHIYRNVWSFCPNVLNFCKYTYFYLFLRNSRHFYFTLRLIPCFVKCPIIKP
jgi:hypothetical protein